MSTGKSHSDRRERALARSTRFLQGEAPVAVSDRLRSLADVARSQLEVLHGVRMEHLTSQRRPLTVDDLAAAWSVPELVEVLADLLDRARRVAG